MADRKVKVILDAQVSGFTAKMSAAGKSVSDAATKMTGAEKESAKFRRGLTSVGDTAGKVGLVAAAGLGAIVYATANFEQAMSNVKAATHETAENMDLLREAAIQAGADTAFSASEAAAGIENLAKAGVSTSDILGGGLAGALDLAAAGELEVADAAEIAATAMTQFNLEGTKVPHIADLLAAAAGKAQGDVSDMAMALKQSGLVASQMGLSIEETTGTLAAFAEAGLLGSDAGTSFRTMLLRLANPSQESADLMKALGINAYDATGAFVGMEAIAGQLQTAFEGKTQAERDSAFATIFGSDAIRAASVLYQRGAEGVADWTAKVDDTGYAAETAGIKLDNLKGDLEALGGSLETALIGAGDGATGPLRSLVQNATDAVNVFNDLPPAIQGSVTSLLGLTAVTGGGLWFGSKVISGVANTRAALMDLGLSADKTKGGLAAVGKSLVIGGAVLAGVNALDKALEDLFNTTLDGSNLDRSLEALSRGEVMGSLAETWGKDLQGFKGDLTDVTWAIENLGDVGTTAGRVLNNIPFDGGFFSGGVDDARENIEKLDQALASLVEGGQQDMAAQIFGQFAERANDAGVSTDKFRGILSEYEVALENTAAKQEEAAGASSDLARLMGAVPGPAKDAAGAVGEFADAAGDGAEAFGTLTDMLDKQSAFGNAKAAMRELSEAFKENGRTLDLNTEKGKANHDQLIDTIEKQLTYAEHLSKPAQTQFLNGVHKALRTTLTEADLLNPRVRALLGEVKALGALPPAEAKVKTKGVPEAKKDLFDVRGLLGVVDKAPANPEVKPRGIPDARQDLTGLHGLLGLVDETNPNPFVELLGAGAANAEIDGVRGNLNRLDGDTARTYIDTVHRTLGAASSAVRGFVGGASADGSTVPDDGGPYADRFPYLLAPLEEVITNRHGEADTFRPELKDINSGLSRAQVWERMMLRGLADGGTVPGLARGGTAKGRSLDQRLDIAQLVAQIGDLRRDLRAKGDDRLNKTQRRVAELQLKIAERDLRAARRQHIAERQERRAERAEARAEARVERERKQLDRARQSLASTQREAYAFSDSVVGAVSSGNPFGNGLEGALLTLEHDRDKARDMLAGTRRAERLGLSDAALRALLESGDTTAANDIDTAAEARQLNRLIAQTQAAQAQLGGFARREVYGDQLREGMRDVQAEVRELREATRDFKKLAETMRPIHQHFPASARPRSVASVAAQRLRARGI